MLSRSFKDLIVWQKSMDLVCLVYDLTSFLPKAEQFGLISQMQRAAVAIPSNIAEGQKRNHRLEFIQFLGIANASSAELETQLLITSKQYPTVDCKKPLDLNEEIQKMLNVLIKNLKNG